VLEVTVAGETDPLHGMVMNLKDLKEIMNEAVVEVYDHRFLNHEVAPFDRVVPTAENIARDIWRRLEPRLNANGRRLRSIRLYETPDLFVDYSGEQHQGGVAA
jgi:6-pyruvoyltetrahydropterin/6-carboxytetrahydropterin synthase